MAFFYSRVPRHVKLEEFGDIVAKHFLQDIFFQPDLFPLLQAFLPGQSIGAPDGAVTAEAAAEKLNDGNPYDIFSLIF